MVVIDDFLTTAALVSLREFCLESAIWPLNRYAFGRLGALFQDGFNCPLRLQIVEELKISLPTLLPPHLPLLQLWGFKYESLPRDTTPHADFAAVNVNFWITPDDANLDSETGGLIIYDVGAPASWSFEMYNRRSDLIEPYLNDQEARAFKIPYRQNRVIIFNSDLFHATDEVQFKDDYESRRINITMLFGDREKDFVQPPERN